MTDTTSNQLTPPSLESAAVEAQRAIRDNDAGRLTQLVAEWPALLSWRDDHGDNLLMATTSYAIDSSNAEKAEIYNRPACAEFLIDAGVTVDPAVWTNVISTRSAGMLQFLWSKGVLPHTLPVLAAVGDLDLVRQGFDESGAVRASARLSEADDLATVNQAFLNACGFKHEAVAAFLLDRAIALDPDLGTRIEAWGDRAAFIAYLGERPLKIERYGADTWPITPWQFFVMRQLTEAMDAQDLAAFGRWLDSDPYVLGRSHTGFQIMLFKRAAWNNREPFIRHLLDREPAVLTDGPPPSSSVLMYALEYGHAHLIPLLTRIWPLPDDLPHAAGMGDLDRVRRWFDAAGQPALGDLHTHYPVNDPQIMADLQFGAGTAQHVLDVALAWACMNRRFDVASLLLDRGADINTHWSTHEPASMLHECAVQKNYDTARFLIARGIDMTIRDFRHNGTAEEWAKYAANDEQMTEFLAAAQRERESGSH
jgi:hypothetical protein